MSIKDVVNDIMVSSSTNNEFTKDGFIKISDSVFFNKYFIIITSVSLVVVGLTNILRTGFSINILFFQFIMLSVFAFMLFIYYLKVGRLYKTIYIKDDSLLILDGYSHKIENVSINEIVDLNGYDGFKGYFRYMVFILGSGKKIYFNPNENANETFKRINQDLDKN